MDVPAGRLAHAQKLRRSRSQHLLRAEHFMAAAKGLDFREHMVKHLHTEGHGVRIVDDPGLRAVLPDPLRDGDVHGQRPEGADHSAGPCRITHRLPDVQPLRHVHIGLHLVKRPRQNGDHHKVRTGQCLLQRFRHGIIPVSHRIRMRVDLSSDDPVRLRSAAVDVVECHSAAHGGLRRQVRHKLPCPPAGPAADIGKPDPADAGSFKFHCFPHFSGFLDRLFLYPVGVTPYRFLNTSLK